MFVWWIIPTVGGTITIIIPSDYNFGDYTINNVIIYHQPMV